MDLRQIIRAEKQDVTITKAWETGPVPRAKFPLLKGKVKFGKGWEWRVASFFALGNEFVVLIALCVEKSYYRCDLALKCEDGALKVLCCHELHMEHKGWHCHLVRGDVRETYPGVMRDKDRMRSWPSRGTLSPDTPFPITKSNAVTLAAARYRFEAGGDLL
tara:strand:- start:3591 stop:4073 length:483 start_codon:yes stop_codon:yes gene_type:complete